MCKITYTRLIFFFVAWLFTACSDHEFPASPYPRIHTLAVLDIKASSVTFQAEINPSGNEVITDHGFLWSNDAGILDLNHDSNKIRLGSFNGGAFEATANSGFTSIRTYYVRAFVTSTTYTVYGEVIQFTMPKQ